MNRENKSTFKALKEITIDNFPKIIQDLLREFYLDDKAIFTAITDTRVTPAETYKFPKDVIFGDGKLYEKLYNAEKNFINKNQMVLDVVNIVVTALQKDITTVNNTIKTLQKTLDGNPTRAGILVIGSVSKFIRTEEAKENNKEPVTKEYDTFKQLLECSKTLISDIYSNYEAIKGQMMPLLCVRIFIEYIVLLNDDESKEKEIIVNIENDVGEEMDSDNNTNPEQEIISEYVEEEPKDEVKEMDSSDNTSLEQDIISEYVETEKPNVQNSIKNLAKNLSTLSPGIGGIGESNMEEQLVNMYNSISSIIQEFSKNKIPETPEQQKTYELFKVDKLPELFDNFIINIGEKISFKCFDFNTFFGNYIYKRLCYVNTHIDKINEDICIIPKTTLRIINKIHTKDVYTIVKSFIKTFKVSDIKDLNESLITICKNLYAIAIVYKILESHGYKFPNTLDEFINQSTDFYSIYEFGCIIKNKLSKYAEMLALCLVNNNNNTNDSELIMLQNEYDTVCKFAYDTYITKDNLIYQDEENNEDDKPEVSDKNESNVIPFNKYAESSNLEDVAKKISEKLTQNNPDTKKINVETPKEKDNESEKFDISKIFDLKKFIIKKLSEYGVTSEVINKEIKGDKNFTSLKDIIEKIDIVYKDKNINEMENRYSIEHFLDIIYSEEEYNSTMSNYKNIFKLSEEDALFTLLTSILCSLENK